MTARAVSTKLRFHATHGVAPGGRLVHRIRSATLYWRGGKPGTAYVNWLCGSSTWTNDRRNRPIRLTEGPATCSGCIAAWTAIEARHTSVI